MLYTSLSECTGFLHIGGPFLSAFHSVYKMLPYSWLSLALSMPCCTFLELVKIHHVICDNSLIVGCLLVSFILKMFYVLEAAACF